MIQVYVSTSNLRSYVRIVGVDKMDATRVMKEVQALWELNISRFFSKRKVSYPLSINRSRKYKPISQAFYCSIVGGVIIGSIDTMNSPHIKHLIYGVPSGEGAFIPVLGVRSKKGYFRGVPTIYWKVWESYFKRELKLLVSGLRTPHKRQPRSRTKMNAVRVAAVGQVRWQISRGGLV